MRMGFDALGSVEAIWLLWAASTLALARVGRRVLARTPWRPLLAREEGMAYSLSFVLTFPLMMLILTLVIESTLILGAKLGTTYASYAAARAGIVWLSAEPRGLAQEKIRLAAVQNLVPFASGNPRHAVGGPLSPSSAGEYARAYRDYTRGGVLGRGYLLNKYAYAERATTIVDPVTSPRWDSDVIVTLSYEHAIHTPVIGRGLGHLAPWPGARFYTYTIESTFTLRNEGPRNDSQSLGIDYVSQ
jgi:hypothetical protein